MIRCTYIDKAKNWGFGIILIIENTVCMYLCIYLFRKFASSATLPFAPNVCQLRNSSILESQLALKRSPSSESYLAPKRFPQLLNASHSSESYLAPKRIDSSESCLAPKICPDFRLGAQDFFFLSRTFSTTAHLSLFEG